MPPCPDLFMDMALEIKAEDVRPDGWFAGHLAYFNNVDLGGDRIMPGAFTESLKKRPAEKVRLLWQHDWEQPIGKYLKLDETKRGLAFEAKLTLGVQKADEARLLMLDGALEGKSIGYRIEDPKGVTFGEDRGKQVRNLHILTLREGSIVTFPMNEKASITGAKNEEELANAIKSAASERDLERALRDAGLSKSVATFLASKHAFSLGDPGPMLVDMTDVLVALRETQQIMKGAR